MNGKANERVIAGIRGLIEAGLLEGKLDPPEASDASETTRAARVALDDSERAYNAAIARGAPNDETTPLYWLYREAGARLLSARARDAAR